MSLLMTSKLYLAAIYYVIRIYIQTNVSRSPFIVLDMIDNLTISSLYLYFMSFSSYLSFSQVS